MNAEKSARLEAALAAIQHKWGVSLVRPLNELNTQRGMATGYPALDALLTPLGVPYGTVTELLGKPTSGMTTLAYSILRQAQSDGGYVLYIDLDSTFDPRYAALRGVELTRLFLARPETNYQALDIAHDVLASGSEVCILLDLGSAVPNSNRLRRVTSVLAKSGCVVLLLIPAGAQRREQESPAALRLLIERVKWLKRGRDVIGWRSSITILKSRQHPESNRIEIDIWLEGHAQTS
jgi:hypothetical protein